LHALTGEAYSVEAMASAYAGLGVLTLILTVKEKRKRRIEVCTVRGLTLGPRAWPEPGSTNKVRVLALFGPGPNGSNQKLHRIFLAFTGHSFSQRKRYS
jgi:hypothetical protein